MKKIVALLLAAVMVFSLAACNNANNNTTPAATEKQTNEQTKQGTDEHEPVTLRFSWWGGDERRDATLAVIQQFEDKYPWITIEAEYGSSDGYNDKLATSLSANTAADIVQIDPAYMAGYVEGHDYFVDYREYGFNLSKFDEAYIGTTMNGGFDGKQWGLPTGVTGTAFMYNKELVEKIGINLDLDGKYTWDEFIEEGKKVKAYDSSLTMFGTNITYLARIVLLNILVKKLGTNLYNKETSPATLNVTKEQIQDGLETIKAMFDNNIVPAASYMASYSGDSLQNDTDWINGKYVFCIDYSSLADVMIAACPDIDWDNAAVPVPKDTVLDGTGGNTGQLISVTKSSAHIDEAMMFVDYFFNDPVAMDTLKATRSVPPTEEARKICEEKGYISKVVASACNYATMYAAIPGDGISSSAEARALMEDAVANVGYGVQTPEQAAEDLYNQLLDLAK